jgi:hypothetical protein
MSLPEVEFGTTWGDRPTYKVPVGDKGRGFVLYRASSTDAIDEATGEPFDDLIVIRTPTAEDKAALVQDHGAPFFTIDHFRNFNAVLVQQSRLGELAYDELVEVISDAWRAVAPRRLLKQVDSDFGRRSP